MATTVFASDATGTGVRAPLADGNDVYVRRGVLVSSSDDHAIDGLGSNHSAVIYGEVVGGLTGLTLGFDATSSRQHVTIYEGGAVSGFGLGYGGAALLGYGSQLTNGGDIWGDSYGVYLKGTRTDASSTIVNNSGTIHGGDYGLYFAGNDAVSINNTGLIQGDDQGIYLLGSAGGFYLITNDGIIDGGIFAAAADFVYYFGQNGRIIDGDIFGGTGSDRLFGGAYAESFTGAGGSDELDGGGGDDRLSGGTEGDTLRGGSGNDSLDGGADSDFMAGGSGDDFYYVDNSGDIVTEKVGEGLDQVNSSVDFSLVGLEVERLFLSTGALKGTGNAYANYVIGNDQPNILDGKQGADILLGGAGDDTYLIDTQGDTIGESAAQGTDKAIIAVSYALGAGVYVEIMQTSSGAGTSAINLYGNEIAQSITGNNGVNRLEGKGGADTLRGLGGADTFVFATKLGGGNIDSITDFNPVDRFLLSDTIFTALTPGTITADQFRANTTGEARDSTDRIVYDTDSGGIFYDPDGLGGKAGVQFATIGVGLAITNADFDVV